MSVLPQALSKRDSGLMMRRYQSPSIHLQGSQQSWAYSTISPWTSLYSSITSPATPARTQNLQPARQTDNPPSLLPNHTPTNPSTPPPPPPPPPTNHLPPCKPSRNHANKPSTRSTDRPKTSSKSKSSPLPLPLLFQPTNHQLTTLYLPGPQPPNTRHIPQHVHVVRTNLPHQHPRLQTETFHRASPILRLRVLPRHPRAGKHTSHHPASAGESLHQSIQRRRHRASKGGVAAFSADRCWASAPTDGE